MRCGEAAVALRWPSWPLVGGVVELVSFGEVARACHEIGGIDVSSKSRFTSCKPHEYKNEQTTHSIHLRCSVIGR